VFFANHYLTYSPDTAPLFDAYLLNLLPCLIEPRRGGFKTSERFALFR
jgi:hypothetical protein